MLKRLLGTLFTKKGMLFVAFLLGVNLALYFSSYLENSPIFIPLGSTRMYAYTLFVSALGTLIYFVSLLWAEKRFVDFSLGKYVALSFFLGVIFFFTNTSQWLEPEFYVRAVLPISYELHLPWYASTPMAYLTGSLFYATLVFLLFALLLPKKDEILATLDEKLGAQNTQRGFAIPDDANENAGLQIQRERDEKDTVLQKSDWLLITAFVIAAFILRVINLNALPPHLEEYQHLIAAKQLLSGTSASGVYQRGFYLVTTPVKWMFMLFGIDVWAARLPGVIVNSLAVMPLYWLVRRYNKKIAIISAMLYTTSPWVIALARPVREYAYQPLMYYLVLASALYLLANIRQGFLLTEWRSLFVKKNIWAWVVLAFFVLFVALIDRYSSFKIVALLYLMFGVFFLARLDWRDKTNRIVVGVLGGVGVLFVGLLSALILTNPAISEMLGNPFRALQVNDILINFRNGNAKFLAGLFFFQPPTQWYYGRLVLFPVLSFFLAGWWGWRTRKSDPVPWFLFVLYAVSLTAFALLYTFIYAARFFLHLQLWFIPLLALGVYGWYLISSVLVKDMKWRVLLWALVALMTVNFPQLVVHTKTDAKPVTNAVHMNFDEVDAYMRVHAEPDDVLISKFYRRYVVFQGAPEFAEIYEASYDEDIIAAHESGWIVVDETRYWAYRKVLKRKNFMVGDVELVYIGEFPDPTSELSNFIWHWDKAP